MLANVLDAEADPGGRPQDEADPGGRPQDEADAAPVAPPSRPWRPEPIPTGTERLVGALRDLLRNLATLPGLVRRTAAGLTAVVRRRRSGALSPPLPFTTPRTSFNRALTPNRWFAMASLPLEEVKAVRGAFGVTINDVVLALCAGALRRYLDERGELP